VGRVYKFIDALGCEIHTIEDPDDKLPIPAEKQVISIGPSTMRVESVAQSGDTGVCAVYFVKVQTDSPRSR